MEKLEYSFAETLLKVNSVSLKIGDFQILRDINVEIKNVVRTGLQQGQVIGFLGPSGVGKCFCKNSIITVKHKKTGIIEKITVLDFLKRLPTP